MAAELVSVDARNKLEDLSGIVIQPGQNPYEVFIKACNDNHVRFTGCIIFRLIFRHHYFRGKWHLQSSN